MSKIETKKRRYEEIFGRVEELNVRDTPSIGEIFYCWEHRGPRSDPSYSQVHAFVYLGTDKKTIKVKYFRPGDKEKYSDILELPLNEEKQALFEPKYDSDMRKSFYITLTDEFGHVEIVAKDRL